MGRKRRKTGRGSIGGGAGAADGVPRPIPIEPVDLLAGLAPGVTVDADPLPAGIAGAADEVPAEASVAEVGRLVRDEPTVRRLIRTVGLPPRQAQADGGALYRPRHTRHKPGE